MDINDPEAPGCYTEHGVSGYGVAVRLSREEPMNEAFVKEMAEKMMMGIADNCMALGARCIGHIKSHLKTEAGNIKADTIGVAHGSYSTGTLTHPVRDLYLAVNSIVQGIPEEMVKSATLEGVHEVADQRGLTLVKEKEHAYFDAFDFLASKQEHMAQLKKQFDEAGNLDSDQEE